MGESLFIFMILNVFMVRPALYLLLIFLLSWVCLDAKIRLPSFFSDNMVLQQKTEAAIWGWGKPNSSIQLIASWNKKKYTVRSDANGKWKLQLTTIEAGGPYEISISDGETVTIRNILLGEVWFCSGQSNMEMPMKGFRDQPIRGSNDAILSSTNDWLRLYNVPRAVERLLKDTTKTSFWKTATPENVSNFSATAYYFGAICAK